MVASARPTIADVARAAGVSIGAVSFALNGRPGVAEATRARIVQVARDVGWTPSRQARSLSTSRALAVGLVIARPPELLAADPFFPAFIAGVETVLAEQDTSLVLQVVSDVHEERAYRRLVADRRADGVFLTDLRIDDPRLPLLRELGLPAVVLGRAQRHDDQRHPPHHPPAVVVDDAPGIRAAVEHLVDLGHTRIAHVAGPGRFVHGASRRAAWEEAMTAAGLRADLCVVADFSAADGARATSELLARTDAPTAVVYANDAMAIAGTAAASAAGVEVPAGLSVTGFDDVELAPHVHPALTTVRTDPVATGRAAATSLLALVGGGAPADVELPPPHLVVRQSCTSPVPLVA